MKQFRGLLLSFSILLCNGLSAQELVLELVDYNCDENQHYLQLYRAEEMSVGACCDVKRLGKIKAKGENIQILGTDEVGNILFVPTAIGKTSIQVIARVDGRKVKQDFNVEVVELPSLEVEIDVTSPDSKFMWLKVMDASTRQPINMELYNLCMLQFQLFDSEGRPKDEGVYVRLDDYFPSVALTELAEKFELNDQLYIELSLVHKNYDLLIGNGGQTMTITQLWK